jgi:hypothetical protein
MEEQIVESSGRKNCKQRGMEEAPENGKESQSANGSGINELFILSDWCDFLAELCSIQYFIFMLL